jgi:hypothetical protein
MYEYIRVTTDNLNNKLNADFLAGVFNKPKLFTPEYIAWQYANNPMGKIVGFNAMAGNTIAAHYVTQPMYAKLNGEITKGLLSLNTATNEQHRGKGLFTKLANKTYEAGFAEGHQFVVGVANRNSVHGMVKSLGFQLVGQLDAKIGLGKIALLPKNNALQFEQEWNKEALAWRLQNPSTKYFSTTYQTPTYFAKTHLPFIKAQMITIAESVEKPIGSGGFNPLTLYIGLEQGRDFKGKLFFDIPTRFRPSPLYLIFRDLTGKGQTLDFNNIRFKLIDFDAY